MLNRLKKSDEKNIKKILDIGSTPAKVQIQGVIEYLKPSMESCFRSQSSDIQANIKMKLNNFFVEGLEHGSNAWHILCSIAFSNTHPITNEHFLFLISSNNTSNFINKKNKYNNTPLQHLLLNMYYLDTPQLEINPARIMRAMLSSGDGAKLHSALENEKMQEGLRGMFNNKEYMAATHIFLGLAAKHYIIFTYQYAMEKLALFNVIIRSTKTCGIAHTALKVVLALQYDDQYSIFKKYISLFRSDLKLICRVVHPQKTPKDFRVSDYFKIFSMSYQSIIQNMINDEMHFSTPNKIKYCSYSIIKWVISNEKDHINVAKMLNNILIEVFKADHIHMIASCNELGADINYVCPNGDTFLIICAKEQSIKCIQRLLNYKKDDKEYLNHQDKDGRTALMHCAISNFQRGVKLLCNNILVEYGFQDIFKKDFYSYQVENGSLNSLQANMQRVQSNISNVYRIIYNILRWVNQDIRESEGKDKGPGY